MKVLLQNLLLFSLIMNKKSIIIVGNGPSLLEMELGKRIDTFENIVRFNGFRTKGYEKFVGSKTTIWSRWYSLSHMQSPQTFREIWLNIPIRDRDNEKLKKAFNMLKKYDNPIEIIPNTDVAYKLQVDLFGSIHSEKWPSSGLLAIAHALAMNYEVVIAGIDSWRMEPFHYYEVHDRSNSNHDSVVEKKYIEQLLSTKRIKFLK
ncbi:MAG: glycosyltransferase family 29 protein [Haliscomenobacter sp.]|nr:glycosyltransferase family 29 protein [Haliscomenobacter sp.]